VIDRIFAENDKAMVISVISITEMVSALNRRKQEKAISKEDLDVTLSRFFHDALKEFLILDISDETIKDSISLVLKRNLRTLDSLQLAVAFSLKELEPVFVCADKNLVMAAKRRA